MRTGTDYAAITAIRAPISIEYIDAYMDIDTDIYEKLLLSITETAIQAHA